MVTRSLSSVCLGAGFIVLPCCVVLCAVSPPHLVSLQILPEVNPVSAGSGVLPSDRSATGQSVIGPVS
jgi:hypothetical protein